MAGAAGAAPGGANTTGPYTSAGCANVDCGPSLNGQGKAPHEAGSKGKADDKNPYGQVKKYSGLDVDGNAIDGNNGYECDANKGVGKGNPAHSGCDAGGGGDGGGGGGGGGGDEVVPN